MFISKKVLILALLSTAATADTGKNSITISDQQLLSGGQEFLIKGNPEVNYNGKFGTVYAGQTAILKLSDGGQRVKHQDGVRIEGKNGLIYEADQATEIFDAQDKSSRLIFKGFVTIYSQVAEKSGGTNTFSCSGGVVHKDGESTRQTEYVYRNVVTVSCGANDNVEIRPASQQIP